MNSPKNLTQRWRRPVTVDDQRQAERCALGRVVLIDDDPEILAALSALLDLKGYACERYASALDYLQILAANQPQFPGPCCVICDVRMPVIDGLELQRRLMDLDDIPLVLMSGESGVQDAVCAFRAGVLDFLIKPVEMEMLFRVVDKALSVSRLNQAQRVHDIDLLERIASLTERERDIARRVVAGELNREIAETLGIGLRTVKLHRQHALEKLGVEKVVDLVRLADKGNL